MAAVPGAPLPIGACYLRVTVPPSEPNPELLPSLNGFSLPPPSGFAHDSAVYPIHIHERVSDEYVSTAA
jgi:hypothetical protein